MPKYKSFASLRNELNLKYRKLEWFNGVGGYLFLRFHPIEKRILETLRYVELSAENTKTFSYEYGSILRDIGSTFGSVLDELVRNTTTKAKREYNMGDYREFLLGEVKDIESIGVELRSPFVLNFVLPFDGFGNREKELVWWNAYNNVKHSEINSLKDASLGNVILGISSLAIVFALVFTARFGEGLFWRVGHFEPIEQVKKFLFVQPSLV